MSTRAPRLRRSRARTITIADARRGSIDADLSPDELEPELRELAAQLRKPARASDASVDEAAAKLEEVATELRQPTRRGGSKLADVVAKLRTPTRRPGSTLDDLAIELRTPTRRPGSTLDDVAIELREPTRRRGSTLDEVAAKLRAPTRRRRGSSLAQVAAKIRGPSPPAGSSLDEAARVSSNLEDSTAGALDFVMPARPISMELVAGRGHYERVIAAVTQARTSVWIATANAKELMVEDARAKPGRRRSMKRASYVSILALLDELASRGVELRLLHAEIPSGPFREEIAKHPQLVGGGLALRRCPRVHMKAVIVDGELLYLGSANWTGAGLGAKGTGRRNFELGIVTDDGQLLDQVQAIYERVWRGVECANCKLRDECPGPLAELGAPLPPVSQIRRRRSRLI